VLISVVILSMIFYVISLPVLFYATILPYIACYCFPSLCYDISHALFYCIILAGPCGSFFLFPSFLGAGKAKDKKGPSRACWVGLDVYRAHPDKTFWERLSSG